jgi:drug/metabolite transporter (DMT)-like permease
MWAGNAIASRLAVGEISPMALTHLRWGVACVLLVIFARREIREAWATLRPHWLFVLLMGLCGFTIFNAMFYWAAHYTTAVNLTLLQGAVPVIVMLAATVLYGTRIGPLQAIGVVMTLVGVATVATHGDLTRLAELDLNFGDLLMLIACLFYAGYTVVIPKRPKVSALAFFCGLAFMAWLTSMPLFIAEIATGTVVWPTGKAMLILLYVGALPSLVSQVTFMRGVELIGPSRAGLFVNLLPVFGALLAVLVLGERFDISHAVAMALVVGGIVLAERTAQVRKPKREA